MKLFFYFKAIFVFTWNSIVTMHNVVQHHIVIIIFTSEKENLTVIHKTFLQNIWWPHFDNKYYYVL